MNDALFSEYENNYDVPICDDLFKYPDFITVSTATILKRKGNLPAIAEGVLDTELIRFYSVMERWELKWRTNPQSPVQMQGTFSFVPIEKVLNADIWDLLPDEYPRMKDFTILDFFCNEAAVGLYLNQPEKGLFYFEFDADPKQLNLDFKGYLEMLKYTKGAAYWQLGAIEPTNRTTNRIVENLQQILPEVSVKGFYELYDSVKLK